MWRRISSDAVRLQIHETPKRKSLSSCEQERAMRRAVGTSWAHDGAKADCYNSGPAPSPLMMMMSDQTTSSLVRSQVCFSVWVSRRRPAVTRADGTRRRRRRRSAWLCRERLDGRTRRPRRLRRRIKARCRTLELLAARRHPRAQFAAARFCFTFSLLASSPFSSSAAAVAASARRRAFDRAACALAALARRAPCCASS